MAVENPRSAGAEAMLRLEDAALQAAADGIVITNRDGAIVWANAAFTALTGYSAAEAIGRRPGELLKSGKHEAAFYAALWATVVAGDVWRGEITNRRKDGRLYDEQMTITPLKDEHGAITHFIAVKQDVTQRKALEEQFRQAQKMESIGRLAGGVAHDFNNMLGVILGHAEIALGQLAPGEPLHADLTEIHAAARRSADLTQQLLAFARKQTLLRSVCDLNEIVGISLGMIQRMIGADIQLVWQPARELWLVTMDQSQVVHILTNLSVNARDAIAGVGTLTISTANAPIDEAFRSAHPAAVPGDYVRLTVRDDGAGMGPEVLANIFEPFFTTKSVGEGTGLGLSTVHGTVAQNGGFITVSSEPGDGAAFDIYLPRTRAESLDELPGRVNSAPREAPAQPLPVATAERETILVVDDQPQLLRLATRALQREGYTVLGATGARDALRLAHEHTGALKLLLTDVTMPDMSGRDLATELRMVVPGLAVVFMSGHAADILSADGELGGGFHFIAKPFSVSALAEKVRAVLDVGRGG